MARLGLVPEAATAPDPVSVALAELAAGRMVLLRDDCERHGEGDLLVAAESADAEAVNLMATEARGLVCLALSTERCAALGLEQIGNRGNHSSLGDSAMVSIEAREGVTTGISAADRARTIAVAIDPSSGPSDLVQPGHVFPLRARPGGVLERAGRTEAAVELATGAGLSGGAVLCQVMRDDGHMAKDEDLAAFAERQGIAILDVSAVAGRARAARRGAAEPGGTPSPAEVGRRMREVMGHFATGVSVVTARDHRGAPVGTTANAISSVSLDPPLLLACLAGSSETLAAVRSHGRFAVNVLAAEQRHHSDRFARKGEAVRSHEVDFDDHDLGVPVLPGSLATVVCEVEALHPAGDHEIVVGRAHHLEHREPGAKPLLFYRGTYTEIRIEEDGLAA
ncbi:MAG TPA: 3,4-dihydroxy-2-butanone-4-phosphate synthase [Solirubrobacterales bacterium]|jgi:3,4-dihydroxy-2-butanone 4-phosphate synthase|nr:3,4-dihydroxy-2-butanone-4-phosphate synthase [Solirubrobacterales bacterium]